MEVELNIYTYTLLAIITSLLFVPLLFRADPDVHPIALLHQSNISPIRKKKESAIYRNGAVPHGAPLRTGLALKGEKAWLPRDGDLRDVWNAYVEKGPGKVLSVKGADVTEVPVENITQRIHLLGAHLSNISGPNKRIAIHLPNDIENLIISFACAFYDLTLILCPYPSDAKSVAAILTKTQADVLVTAAGVIPLNDLQAVKSLNHIVYVVEPASRDLDWATPPGSRLKTRTFHDLVSGDSHPAPNPPKDIDPDRPAIIITYTPLSHPTTLSLTTFSTRHLVAALGAQISSLPPAERFTPQDTFLPYDTLSTLYPRLLTYTALFSGSLLALTASASPKTNLLTTPAQLPFSPTITVASSHALLRLIRETQGTQMELWHKLLTFFQSRTLSSGRIPRGNWLTRINDYVRPQFGPAGTQHKLRLVFTHELALAAGGMETQPLNSLDLNDLRMFLAARVVYALCSPRVAGAVCAQHVYDYRVERLGKGEMPSRKRGVGRRAAWFGAPLGGGEVWVRDVVGGGGEGGKQGRYSAEDEGGPRGEVWVRGPVVPGGEVGLGVVGRWRGDGCLEFV